MMALSLINIPATSPTAPAAPPGVAPAIGVFDLLLPIADPSDPRHEPAPDGKQIGKDMPVDEAEAPAPLAWLDPPVAPQVSPIVSTPISQAPATTETPAALESAKHAVSRPVGITAGEAEPPVAMPGSPAAQPIALKAGDDAAPVGSPSPPLPTPAGEGSVAPPAVISATTVVQVGTAPLTAIGITVPTSPPVTAAPVLTMTVAPPSPIATASASPKSSGATSPREAGDLAKSVSRQEPGVATEILPAPLAPVTPTPRIAPAALVFADAIHRAVTDDRNPATPDAAAFTPLADLKTHAIAATADAQHNALDLRQEQWPARMIERIEALRDAANANDTSIRLIPDALGKIDVSLKRDGETVAVHFTAQQPETRQLLADAAPKLAELAEARGLKLAQNGADTAGQQQPRQQPATTVAAAPRRADADDTESTDIRIA